ncbi:hypothetical protein NMG46_12775 [Mesorhizobium sp. LMG 17147]|uniref:hypothetical protein n=1 Tax=Mesorhizobium sp. LMG 17147 TaxID=2963091 RepID=UPI0020C9D9C9|nr:hypothetical protein [Mesorhizobium sp. LMG 17147]MCP9231117.1 hypothetical protein [Mesorhizobium sp. LMG 17147]
MTPAASVASPPDMKGCEARKGSADNLLNGDFIDGPLCDVQREPVAVHCGLIEENVDTKLKP